MDFILFIVLALSLASTQAKPSSSALCLKQGMAKYNVTFETFWTEDRFPKQFPTFRPHAQWAKLIGRTHSSMYRLWEEGALASAGVMEYVEEGSTEALDQEIQGTDGILDTFNTKNVELGIGSTSVNILADPFHSKLSVMARMVPSPDWFVGADSVELCKDGQWLDKLTYDLPPYDAGTDRGFTFTAPNWPEIPYKEIYQITAKLPNHPANSFFYPELDELPTLATLTLVRVDTIAQDKATSFTDKETLNDDNSQRHVSSFHPQEPVVFNQHPPGQQPNNQLHSLKQPEFSLFRTDMRPKAYTLPPVVTSTRPPRTVRPRRPAQSNAKYPISCEVSEWDAWTPCSKTCGYGTRMRTRHEISPAQNGGAPCPVLKEEEMCGSMRSCTWNHFSTFGGGKRTAGNRARSGATTGRRRSTLFRRRKMRKQSQKSQA